MRLELKQRTHEGKLLDSLEQGALLAQPCRLYSILTTQRAKTFLFLFPSGDGKNCSWQILQTDCIGQLAAAMTKQLGQSTCKEKRFTWLIVSEVSADSHGPYCSGVCDKANHEPW